MTSFIIRNLRPEDIPELLALPKTEGREMGGEGELLTWLRVDPRGLFVAESALNGEIGGCCCGVALSDTHGYVGMYVVKASYRGCGLGRALWNAAIDRLGARNVSLSTADKMLGFYRHKAGFTHTATWTVDLYTADELEAPCNVFSTPLPFTVVVPPLSSALVQLVLDYDQSLHQYDRSKIVLSTIAEEGTLTLLSVSSDLGESARTTGYACMKKSIQGHWLIAPVYADDFASARSLVNGLINSLSDAQRKEGVVAKLVSSNLDAAKLFQQIGMKRSQYRLSRLFTKGIFEIPERKVFALQTSVFCTE